MAAKASFPPIRPMDLSELFGIRETIAQGRGSCRDLRQRLDEVALIVALYNFFNDLDVIIPYRIRPLPTSLHIEDIVAGHQSLDG
jgi:hypothetical protein